MLFRSVALVSAAKGLGIDELILATEYPTAGVQVSGVDCFYVISAKVYNGLETFTYTYTFKGLGNAKFELQGEPEVTK